MSAKLRPPWATKRLTKPAPSATVFLLEVMADGKWHPIVERHLNCRGMDPHETCTVTSRVVGPAADSRAQAEKMLRTATVTVAKTFDSEKQ